jgi:hypothetical protein
MFDMSEVLNIRSRHSQRYQICVLAEQKKEEIKNLFIFVLILMIFLFISVFIIGVVANGKLEYSITIFHFKIHFFYIFLIGLVIFFSAFRFTLKYIENWKERELQDILTFQKTSKNNYSVK